jgi:hypothetical protein
MTNDPRVDVTEQYGGKAQEQTDYAKTALRYQNRFEPDREPRGHNMGDTDEVKG